MTTVAVTEGEGAAPEAVRPVVALLDGMRLGIDCTYPEGMQWGHVCLVSDAAWVARPHAAAGTAKAAADAWALAEALQQTPDTAGALAAWEPRQMALGRQLVDRTRRIGRRSQVDNSWDPRDPELIFGLYGPGE